MRAVVDTSLWIDAWRGDVTEAEKQLIGDLWRLDGVVLPQWVWLELQVGLRSPAEHTRKRNGKFRNGRQNCCPLS